MAHLRVRHEQIANDGEVVTDEAGTRHCEVVHACIERTVTYSLTAQWARTNVGRALRPTHLYDTEQMAMAVRMISVRLDLLIRLNVVDADQCVRHEHNVLSQKYSHLVRDTQVTYHWRTRLQ